MLLKYKNEFGKGERVWQGTEETCKPHGRSGIETQVETARASAEKQFNQIKTELRFDSLKYGGANCKEDSLLRHYLDKGGQLEINPDTTTQVDSTMKGNLLMRNENGEVMDGVKLPANTPLQLIAPSDYVFIKDSQNNLMPYVKVKVGAKEGYVAMMYVQVVESAELKAVKLERNHQSILALASTHKGIRIILTEVLSRESTEISKLTPEDLDEIFSKISQYFQIPYQNHELTGEFIGFLNLLPKIHEQYASKLNPVYRQDFIRDALILQDSDFDYLEDLDFHKFILIVQETQKLLRFPPTGYIDEPTVIALHQVITQSRAEQA